MVAAERDLERHLHAAHEHIERQMVAMRHEACPCHAAHAHLGSRGCVLTAVPARLRGNLRML
jgi:hypothetical protein